MNRRPRGIRPRPVERGAPMRPRSPEPPRQDRADEPAALRTPARPVPGSGHALPDDVALRAPMPREVTAAARIHTDAAAGAAALVAGANAMTIGRDIYFAPGAYEPGTPEGDARLAHELTHVDQYMRGDLAGRGAGIVPESDRAEREAGNVEASVSDTAPTAPTKTPAISPSPVASVSAPVLRQPTLHGLGMAELWLLAQTWDFETEIDLQGRQYMPDLPAFCAYLMFYGGPELLKVRFGTFARGQVAIHIGHYDDGHHGFYTNWMSEIYMQHPALPDVPNQRMAIAIDDDEIFGAVGRVGDAGGVAMDTQIALGDWASSFTPGLLQLPDYRDVAAPPLVTNGIDRSGNLSFSAVDYDYNLPGPGDSRHAGKASLTIDNATGTVTANATIRAPGLGDGSLTLNRLPGGSFTGTATMSVGPFGDARGGHAGFSGTLRVTYGRRVLDVTGTVNYDGARVSGTGTLRLTDAATAWDAVRPHIIAAVGMMPPITGPTTGMALTGWGSMTYRFGDWLTGRAAVVVAPDGHIYSRGEIRPTAQIRFLDPPRRWHRKILGPIEGTIDLFEALAVNIEGGGRVELWGTSEFGPAMIHRLNLIGAFSTNTAVPWQLQMGGTLSLHAMASLEVRATVFLRGRALHLATIAEVSGTIYGDATIRALAEATVSIGRRLGTTNPEDAEYFIKGNFGAYARLAVGLRGSIDFSAFGSDWNIWRSDRYEWPIGDVGLERHFDYVLGTAPSGNVSVEAPGVASSARGLISAIAHQSPPRNAPGGQRGEAEGRWRDQGPTGGPAPFEAGARAPAAAAIEADLPSMDPITITPGVTVPPSSGGASSGAGDPDAGTGGQRGAGGTGGADAGGTGGADAGPVDANGQPIGAHGVPMPPPPYDVFPDLPSHTPLPISEEEIVVPFTMKGIDHRLRLIPDQPRPRLIMESAPDDLSDKIDDEIVEQRTLGDTDEVTALEGIKTQAEQVVTQADELGFGVVPNVTVPVEPIAEQLHTHGEQFDQGDLNNDLMVVSPAPAPAPVPAPGPAPAPGPTPTPVPPGPVSAPGPAQLPLADTYDPNAPTPTDAELLTRWDAFVAQVDATTDPIDAQLLVEQERRYLNRQFTLVTDWLNAHNRWDPGYADAERRRQTVVDRLGWCIRRGNALRTAVNPNHRVALPCFPAGTLVHTPSGVRAIESLRVGDDVWSIDPDTGIVVASQVEGLLISRAVDLFTLRADDRALVEATGNHPFWVDDTRSWIPAAQLDSGSVLRTRTGTVTISAVERREVTEAMTFNLALGPIPTFLVGDGVLVHNGSYALWHTYPWGNQFNFKIYIGLNNADEFRDYVYVGQTSQEIREREEEHHDEANRKLRRGGLSADDRFFFRFKQGMYLTAICVGLKGENTSHSNQAKYLEQLNINKEREERGASFVLNRIEVTRDMPGMSARILSDPDCDVRAAGYCLTPP